MVLPIALAIGTRVAAAALGAGARTAVTRWAGGNVLMRAVGGAIADKAIDEAKDFVLHRKEWQDTFRDDPAEKLRSVVSDVGRNTFGGLFGNPRESADSIVDTFSGGFSPVTEGLGEAFYRGARDGAISSVGREVERGVNQYARGDRFSDVADFARKGFDFDLGRASRDYASEVLNQGFSWAEQQLGRGRQEEVSIEDSLPDIQRDFEENIDERVLNTSLLGDDSDVIRMVARPAEDALRDAMDVNYP